MAASTNDLMAGVLDGIIVGATIGNAKRNAQAAYDEAMAAYNDARRANFTAEQERRARVAWQNYAAKQDETIALLETRIKFLEGRLATMQGKVYASEADAEGIEAGYQALLKEAQRCPHKEHHKFSSNQERRTELYNGVVKLSLDKKFREDIYGKPKPKQS